MRALVRSFAGRGTTAVLLAVVLLVTASCGGGGVESIPQSGCTLEGRVTYNGQPVPSAIVRVTRSGPGGNTVTATTNDDGMFTVSNVPEGMVKIGVNTDAAKGLMMSRSMAGIDQTKKADGQKKATVPKAVDLPKKYHDPETSGLSCTIQKGSNKQEFDIKG